MENHEHADGFLFVAAFAAVLILWAVICLWAYVLEPRFADINDRISALETPVAEEQP